MRSAAATPVPARARHGFRTELRRVVRHHQRLTAASAARLVGCHTSTARRHLRPLASRDTLAAGFAWERRIATAALSSRPAVLASRSCDQNPLVREAVAANLNCPPAVVARLAADGDRRVRAAAAAHPRIEVAVLARLASDPDDKVSACAFGNARLPRLLLRRAPDDPRLIVRAAAARSPRCPQDALARLVVDSRSGVRAVAAGNPDTPTEMLLAALADKTAAVQRAVAANPSCPPQTLRWIGTSRHDLKLRSQARQNPSYPPDALRNLIGSDKATERLDAAHNPSCPPKYLHWLADDSYLPVRAAVAANSATPTEAFELLHSSNYSNEILLLMAANMSCPPSVLARLSADSQPRVRVRALEHPACPTHALTAAVDKGQPTAMLAHIAAHPNVGAQTLDRLAREGAARVRAACGTHPRCTPEMLRSLATDRDPVVREAALSSLAIRAFTAAPLAEDAT